MSIKSQIEAAKILIESNMPHEALTNIMIAIAASSRRLYSRNSKKDNEAFTLFLGQRLARTLICNYTADSSGIFVYIKGKQKTIEDILYHNYRCQLIHEAELPFGIEFVEGKFSGASITTGGDSEIKLDYGWLPILISVVVNAPSNYDLFNNGFKRLESKKDHNDEVQFKSYIIQKFDISIGRFEILKEICAALGVEDILLLDIPQLKNLFFTYFVENSVSLGFNNGIYTGLFTVDLVDRDRQLTTLGANVLKEIANFYE